MQLKTDNHVFLQNKKFPCTIMIHARFGFNFAHKDLFLLKRIIMFFFEIKNFFIPSWFKQDLVLILLTRIYSCFWVLRTLHFLSTSTHFWLHTTHLQLTMVLPGSLSPIKKTPSHSNWMYVFNLFPSFSLPWM